MGADFPRAKPAGERPVTPPALADREGTDIRHLISEADAGAWEFALSCGSFVHFLTDDGNRAACNRAFLETRFPHSTTDSPGEANGHA